MLQKGNWSEKDEATIQAIVTNMINQKNVFIDLVEKSELKESFKIKNPREYVLGLFTGIVINLFANYWIDEHEVGLLPDDLKYLYHKISSFKEDILNGLFE